MPIDPKEYEKRLACMEDLFKGIAKHAEVQAMQRCPYKNRFDQCTATFGCRNKRKPRADGQLPACVSDDRLDYRPAWESDPDGFEQVRAALKGSRAGAEHQSSAMATVSHDDEHRPAAAGKTIFDYADELSVRVPTSCGRTGHCHECVVQIKGGMEALCPRTEAEAFLRDEYRLACQAVVQRGGLDVSFTLLRRTPRILKSRRGPGQEAGPGADPGAGERARLDPAVTRRGDQVLYDGEPIDSYRGGLYGIAMDLGTTTVVAELIDLESGELVYECAFENPQRFGGSDVMHRISYDGSAYHGELHRAIINALNTEIRQMCAQLDVSRRQIYEVLVVGNATMRDLFFDLDVQPIGQKPYKSTIEQAFLDGQRDTTALNVSARKLALYVNPKACVFGAPLIASHVGADVVADLVAIDMASQNEVVMLVDAGTNTEVVIGHKDRLLAASCPAGPAFEGGLVTFGMPGCDGAIESIRYVPEGTGRFECKTIGDVEPSGICGSGLIDLLAELRRHDLSTPKGVFANKATQFTIVPEQGITFSRRDSGELAQAKAANYCGQMILMRKFGVRPDQIKKLYLAGGFANYVNAASAVEIGFLAPVPTERIVKVGNAAAQGARQLLLSKSRRASIEQLIRKIEHVELETMPDFFDVFVEGCQIKPMIVPHSKDSSGAHREPRL